MIKIQVMYPPPFTQSINDTKDVEYDSVIADVQENRVMTRVDNGEVINDDIYIKK